MARRYDNHNSLARRDTTVATRNNPLVKIEKNSDLILADISGSMAGRSSMANLSCWSCLKQALQAQGERAAVLAFETFVHETTADNLPPPTGGTNLTGALEHAMALEPLHVLVISDGEPNNPETALEAASRLANDCIIDVLYIGPNNEQAKQFMRSLAEVGRGRYMEFDLTAEKSPLELTSKVSSLLALPGPGTIEL